MATEGSDLSTRMSAEKQRLMREIAVKLFKKHKVEISDAIKAAFPFFEMLRDHGLITNEKYNESRKSCENMTPVPKVVYDVFSELEEKYHLSLLEILFSKVIMKNYPDLNDICKGFRDVIQKKICHQESDGESVENPNTQLKLGQGTGEHSCPSLSWLSLDQPNDQGTAPPENGPSGYLCGTTQINEEETGMIRDNNELESQQANEQCAQESETAGAELPNCGIPVNADPVFPVDIEKTMPAFNSGGECEAQARTDCNQACDVIVTSSEDSAEHRSREEPPEASTSAPKTKPGTVDLGEKSSTQKTKKKRWAKNHEEFVDFHSEILPVTCGEMKGMLYKNKLEEGSKVKCIETKDGHWFTPKEFSVAGGYQPSTPWKTTVRCGGETLKKLMEEEKLPTLPKKTKQGNRGFADAAATSDIPGPSQGQPTLVFDIASKGKNLGRVSLELFDNKRPKTTENFHALGIEEKGPGYKSS